MYRYFLQAANEFFGSEHASYFLLALALVAALVSVVLLTPSLRIRLEALAQTGRFWGQAAYFAFTTLQVVLVLTGLFLLCALLHVQAGLLSERQGQVTQRNYDAVRTKWGIPQELRMLKAELSITEKVTAETFAGEGEREIAVPAGELMDNPEGYKLLSDESFPIKRDKDNKVLNPLDVARRQVFLRQKTLPLAPVVASTAEFDLKYNPRYLGGAGYPGYEYKTRLRYEVVNRSESPALGEFSFALPGKGYGVYNDLSITVDGAPQNGIRFLDGALQWRRTLPAGARQKVEIAYHSRGLQFLRYTPGNFLERCRVAMNVSGFDAARLDFPIGAMSPKTDLKTLSGERFTLEWDLSNAVTNYSIGIVVPSPRQPGFAASVVLKQAPLGMALLLLALLVSRRFLGAPFCYASYGLALILGYFGYALFAYLSDGMECFYWAYLLALAVPALAGGAFWVLRDGRGYLGWQSGALYVLFAAGYPLAAYYQDYTGVALNCAYLLLTGYLMLLYVTQLRRRRAAAAIAAAVATEAVTNRQA